MEWEGKGRREEGREGKERKIGKAEARFVA